MIREIKNRKEPFVDEWLIEKKDGLSLKLGTPVSLGRALTFDRPWERGSVTYLSLIQDGNKALLYYRGNLSREHLSTDFDDSQVTCVAKTDDGNTFERIPAGIYEPGLENNNIILKGEDSHNFAPFYDDNPECPFEERYKAVAGEGHDEATRGLREYFSKDGIHWNLLSGTPVITKGQFDSHNVAFYDKGAGLYRCYCRYWIEDERPSDGYHGIRGINSVSSKDFKVWTDPVENRYGFKVTEHFYTNSIVSYPGAEHILVALPMRFNPEREKNPGWPAKGVSDSVFMSSRNGEDWSRPCREAFIRAGIDRDNWGDRSQIMTRGLYVHEDGSVSMYIDRHYRLDSNFLEHYKIRPDGFMSLHAGWDDGNMITYPLTFGKEELTINASTGAYGYVKITLLDESGNIMPGYEGPEWYGDSYGEIYGFEKPLSDIAGKPVRLRVELKDADLYSIQVRQ